MLGLFQDQDVYKTLESLALRNNQCFKDFLCTISLDEFEILMAVVQVINSCGVLYDNHCLLFPNIQFSQTPNCTIEWKTGRDSSWVFDVKSASRISSEDKLTVHQISTKDTFDQDADTDDISVVFRALDCDGDEFLCKEEFVNALNLITPFSKEEADGLFVIADHDCDGKIGLEDFIKFVRKYK